MTAWKAKLIHVLRKVDKLGSGDREKVLPNIENLYILLEEMSDRVQSLKTESPSDCNPNKKEIDNGSTNMRGKYEEVIEYIG